MDLSVSLVLSLPSIYRYLARALDERRVGRRLLTEALLVSSTTSTLSALVVL